MSNTGSCTYCPSSNGRMLLYCISIISVNPMSVIALRVLSDTAPDSEEKCLSFVLPIPSTFSTDRSSIKMGGGIKEER